MERSEKNILERFLKWFFPFYCLGCRKEDETICAECLGKVPRLERQVCPYCRVARSGGRTCDFCLEGGAVLDGLLVVSVYEKRGLIAKALHNFKYNGQLEFGEKLGGFMNNFLDGKNGDFLNAETIICPIPLFPEKEKVRGFNQSEILAEGIDFAGKRISLLKRISYEKAQMTLRGEERVANVRGVFQMIESFSCLAKGQQGNLERVVLIDDVATTLATMEEAARTLKAGGVKEVYGLVLAREQFELETKIL